MYLSRNIFNLTCARNFSGGSKQDNKVFAHMEFMFFFRGGEEREGDKYREIFLLALFIVANKSRQPRRIRLLKSLMSIP